MIEKKPIGIEREECRNAQATRVFSYDQNCGR
jgi:hypothetical protein